MICCWMLGNCNASVCWGNAWWMVSGDACKAHACVGNMGYGVCGQSGECKIIVHVWECSVIGSMIALDPQMLRYELLLMMAYAVTTIATWCEVLVALMGLNELLLMIAVLSQQLLCVPEVLIVTVCFWCPKYSPFHHKILILSNRGDHGCWGGSKGWDWCWRNGSC